MSITALSLSEHARPSNCATDLLLCAMHAGFAMKLMKLKPAVREANPMYALVGSYFTCCILWQAQGAWNHLFDPVPAELSFSHAVYLMLGAGCPALYGCALSLSMKPVHAFRWCMTFAVLWLSYVALALLQVDLADYLPLPRTQELTLSVSLFNWLPVRLLPWLPHVQAASGGAGHSITILWDGRGYAAVPFEHAFSSDRMFADRFELISPHPCWKVHSFPFLFLIFGLGLNTVFLAKTLLAFLGAAREDAVRRHVFKCFVAHVITTVGVAFMPVAMLFTSVEGGINWMHLVMFLAMYLQGCGLEDAIRIIDGVRKSQ